VSSIAGKRPFFINSRDFNNYNSVLDQAYALAKEEAMRIYQQRGIQTKIELLKPVHLGYTATGGTMYTLPATANSTYTLKSNVAFFPFGVVNQDPTWYSIKWYEGAATKYIADWYVRPVYFFQEQEGAWGGQLEPYAFRGDQSFTFYNISNAGNATVYGWILAFVTIPTTLEETKIIV
jgi:hypothetical protein